MTSILSIISLRFSLGYIIETFSSYVFLPLVIRIHKNNDNGVITISRILRSSE